MARLVNKLSTLRVANLVEPGWYSDGAGLWLQLSPSGSKSWVFRYSLERKRFHMGLGSARDVSLAEARKMAADCRLRLRSGGNPLLDRQTDALAQRAALARRVSFDDCASAYIKAHRASWRNAKHQAQWVSTLANYASPVFGALPVQEVDTAMVVKVLGPIWTTRTETAVRLRGRIESILDWATVSKFRTGENPARWRGHLDHLLANPSKVAPHKHRPALPWAEAPAFMVELRKREGVSAKALEFAIFTAARSGEVRGATWSEISWSDSLWVVPAERMKAGREHRVPLPEFVVTWLRQLKASTIGDLIFPGRGGKPMSDMSLTEVLRRMGRDEITVHGFRSTFRDWCAEYPANSFSREICEHALAHQLPDKVEAAYRRGDLLDKRRLLMAAWADYLNG